MAKLACLNPCFKFSESLFDYFYYYTDSEPALVCMLYLPVSAGFLLAIGSGLQCQALCIVFVNARPLLLV